MLKMDFNKHDVIAMHAELATACERVHKRIKVRELATSHKLDHMNHLRLLKKLAAWRRTNGFDRNEVLAERQHRPQGHVCSVDDPKHYEYQIDEYNDP